jgi:hypothetical protein
MRCQGLLLTFLLLAFGAVLADNDEALSSAEDAAVSWLELTDADNYQQSWNQASSLFRNAVSLEDWTKALSAARGPLEALVSRSSKSAEFYRELPGAPDGEYVVLTFDSVFANKASAVETVTMMKDDDGAWRLSGYFIR